MNDQPPVAGDATDREILLTRDFDAPRDLVFKAWTDPRHVVHWWGPDGFTNTFLEIDVRPGGVWRFIMHGPDGVDYPNRIVFSEVVPPVRLAYAHGEDDGGPPHFHVTVHFDDLDGRTRVTLRLLFETAAQRDQKLRFGALEGGRQTLNRLAAYLATATI